VNTGQIVVLIILVVLIVGGGVVAFVLRSARQAKERARIAAMTPAEREHHDATVEYKAGVTSAEKAHSVEENARDIRLNVAGKALAVAEHMGNRKLGSYTGKNGRVSLTETRITTPQGTFLLDATVNAIVDTAGSLATSSRSTLTRIATGGLLFGPVGATIGGVAKKNKKHDTRELYLLVEGTGFATLITCKPDDGPKVRQLAIAIRQAGMYSANLRAQRTQAMAIARVAVEAEQANIHALDSAATVLEAAKGSTARIEAAAEALGTVSPFDSSPTIP
jgi:hypothetical protein